MPSTHNRSILGNWTDYVPWAFFMLLGLSAGAAQCVVDIEVGLSHTTRESCRILQPALFVIMEAMGLGISYFAGKRWCEGGKLMSASCFLLAAYFLAYSFSNSVGFSYEQTVGKQKLVELQNKQARDIAELHVKRQVETRREFADFAKRTYLQAQGKGAKAEARQILKDTLEAPVPIVPPHVEDVMADGKAEAFGALLGLQGDVLRFWDSVWLAFGICLTKFFAPVLASACLPRPSRKAEVIPTQTRSEAGAPAAPPAPLGGPEVDDLRLVKEWLQREMDHDPAASVKTQAADALHRFNEWKEQTRPELRRPPMTQTMFGRCMRKLGVKKKKIGQFVFYLGLRPRQRAAGE